MKYKNKQGIQQHIQHTARNLTIHTLTAFALRTETLAERKAAGGKRGSHKNKSSITHRVRKIRFRRAQQKHQRLSGDKSDHCHKQTKEKAQEKGCAHGDIRLFLLLCAEHSGNQVGSSGSYPEAKSIQNHRNRKYNTHGGRCTGTDLSHKKRIRQVINAVDQSCDHTWYSQRQDQF